MSSASEHSGHRMRMKQKFQKHGMDKFDNREVLEILLYYAIPRKDTYGIAKKLMEKFGSLSGVIDAPYELLIKEGLTENAAFLLKFLPEFIGVYTDDKFKNSDSEIDLAKIPQRLVNKFVGKKNECTFVIMLNPQYKEIYSDFVAEGSLTKTDISTRRICELAVRFSARYVIVSHNHPSGNSLPSTADIVSTINLNQALRMLGVELLDHYVVANDDCVSFQEANVFFNSMEDYSQSSFYNSSLFT